MIMLRFKGSCCFATGRETDPFVKRVLLPRDAHWEENDDQPHIPHVEVEADDLAPEATVTATKTFTRGEGVFARTFHRFDLDGERISIRSAAQGNGRLLVVPTFDERIPKMTLVCPDCPPNPRLDCFEPNPPTDLVAAYFDIRTGYLNAGPLELEETRFDEGSEWPPRRLAHWVRLDLAIQGDRAEVVIEKYDGSGIRIIPLKRGASVITIGNAREEDIEETSMRSNRRDHFDMFYDLGANLPEKRPRPQIPKTAIRACAPVDWP